MTFKVGVGTCDITGPCLGVGFMGMSNMFQRGEGIHTRLFSRAFVIEDLENGKSAALVVADLGMCFQSVHQAVVKKLKRHPRLKIGGRPAYTEKNVLITGTHTHSGPGGYSHSFIYNLAIIDLDYISGFNSQNFQCIVDGIFQSILRAHDARREADIGIARGVLSGCGKIRSLAAYDNNPAIERGRYVPDDLREMTQLHFMGNDGCLTGVLNWYALHPTNMGERNKLISGDNKGYAEERLERDTGAVAAFANSCCGDITPNVDGPPDGVNDLRRAKETGESLVLKALDLLEEGEALTGPLDYRQTYVDMSRCLIRGADGRTWPAALGLGMSQGSSEDSKGPGRWPEGTRKPEYDKDPEKETALERFLLKLMGVKTPDELPPDYIDGHGSKPLFVHLGLSEYKGFPLAPSIMPLQLIRLGSLVIIAHPGEMSLMAGRRMRRAVLDAMDPGVTGIKFAVVATYSGAYTSYTTTEEEYAMQHYEGASTLFGPGTLQAYTQENLALAEALRSGRQVPAGPGPRGRGGIYRKRKPVIRPDVKPVGHDFGDREGPRTKASYARGETARVSFWGGHPNHNLQTGRTYLEVQRREGARWVTEYTDRHFCTIFRCHRRAFNIVVEIEWHIPEDQASGRYRLCYFGHRKISSDELVAIHAESDPFTVG